MYTVYKRRAEVPYCFLAKVAFILVFMTVLFFLVIWFRPERTAAAGKTTTGTYQIASVKIEVGDSLWSIASEYFTDDFVSIRQYISEIKRMNNLTGDTLYAGGYILVPYYAE